MIKQIFLKRKIMLNKHAECHFKVSESRKFTASNQMIYCSNMQKTIVRTEGKTIFAEIDSDGFNCFPAMDYYWKGDTLVQEYDYGFVRENGILVMIIDDDCDNFPNKILEQHYIIRQHKPELGVVSINYGGELNQMVNTEYRNEMPVFLDLTGPLFKEWKAQPKMIIRENAVDPFEWILVERNWEV